MLEADRAEIAAHHRRLTAAGTSLTWIRAVEPPLNPYVRWNLHVLRIREQYGTDARIVGPQQLDPREVALPS